MQCACQRSVGQCPGIIANEVLRVTNHREEQPSRASQAAPASAISRAGPRALTQQASNSRQRPGYGSFTRAVMCSGKAEINRYPSPWLSHPVGSHAVASATVAQWSASTSCPNAKYSLVHIGNPALPQGCNLTQRSSGHATASRVWPPFHFGSNPACLRARLNSNVRAQYSALPKYHNPQDKTR